MTDLVRGGGESRDARRRRRALLRRLLEERAQPGRRLSVEQERLWVSNQRDPTDPSQNIRTAIRIRGPFDETVFRSCVDRLVARHAQLRARVRERDGRPQVDIASELSLQVGLVDLRDGGPDARDDREVRLRELIRAEAARPFDLDAGPPLRVALFVVDDEEHVVVLTVHHIVFDRRSMDVLLQELCELYDAGVSGRPADLPELERSYQDFALAQAETLDGPAGEAMSEFWRDELAGYQGGATGWFGRRSARATSMECSTLSAVFPTAVGRRVLATAARLRATPFMVLLAGLSMLLRRIGAGEDLVVVSPAANREDEAWEGLVGNFVNLLPLRVRPGLSDSLETMVPAVRRTVLDAHRNQQLPLHRIAQAAGLPPAGLLQLFFQHDAGPVAPRVAGGASFEPQPIDLGTSHHELAVSTYFEGERLVAVLRYRAGWLERETADSLLGDLESILGQVTSDEGLPVSDLDVATVVTPNERVASPESPAASARRPAAAELTSTEVFLTDLWCDLLDLPDVTPRDNFLDVGGDSLLAMQVIERVEGALGVRLVPAELFTQTLAQIAASCEARRA